MTYKEYLLEGANGTALTAGNTGANQVSLVGGGTGIFSTAAARSGATGGRFTNSGANNALIRFLANAVSNTMSGAFDFKIDAIPTVAAVSVATIRHASGVVLRFQMSTAGKIRTLDSAGTLIDSGGNEFPNGAGSSALSANTWYRIEYLISGASATAGSVQAKISPAASGTMLTGGSVTSTTANVTVNAIAGGDFGNVGGTTETRIVDIDNVRFDDGSTSYLGQHVLTNAGPVVSAVAPQNLAAGATATIGIVASDTDGIASYASTVVAAKSTATPTLTGASTANVTFTVPAAGNVVVGQTVVTDSLGASTTVEWEVRSPLAGSATVVPLNLDGTSSGVSRVGGTTGGGVIADATDATYLESGALSGTEQWYEFRWQPTGTRASGQLTPIRLGTDTGTGNATVYLKEGGTVRQSWTQAIGSTATDYTFTLSAGTIAAIGDWSNLYCRVGFTA